MALKMNRRSLEFILLVTESQRSCCRMGVMWWDDMVLVTILAAEIWTIWKVVKVFVGKTIEERVAIVNLGGDKTVNKDGGSVGSEEGV